MSHPGSAAPSVEERIAELERRAESMCFCNSPHVDLQPEEVRWLIAELRARDEALREARKDSARLDWLRESGDDTGWRARESTTGRGYRLHQPGPCASPREAIELAMSASLARTEGGDVGPDGTGASR